MSELDGPIGVGMGGACPSCSAPVDLGQQYCLECGASLRSRIPKRRADQAAAAPAGPSPVLVAPAQRGFPWVPFTIVLVLVATGLAFAMMEGEPSGSKGKTKKDDPSTLGTETGGETLPSVDEDTCEPVVNTTATTPGTAPATDTTPSSETVTGASTTQTTPPAPTTSDGSVGSLLPGGSSTTSTGAITSSTTATTPTTAQVYTDQDGNLCTPTTGTDTTSTSVTTPTTPTTPTSPLTGTTPTSPTTSTGSTGSSGADTTSAKTWPAGRSGYTVVIASFPKSGYDQSDAEVRATQAQRNGITAGVLDSDQFSSLTGGLWVVFSGVFSTESAANSHKSTVTKKGYQPYVRQVTPG